MALEEAGTAQVSLANRADLFRLVAFLDRLLPEENDVSENNHLNNLYIFLDKFILIFN